MSWAEVKIINDNFKVPLNTQIEKIGIVRSWLFETTTTWTPPYSGKYRIFCIGAGGDGEHRYGGGAGGAGMLDTVLSSTTSYNITVGSTASFGNLISATSGGDGDDNNGNGAAGTVSGTGVVDLGSSAGSRTGGSINGSFCLGGTWLNSTGGKGESGGYSGGNGLFGGEGGDGSPDNNGTGKKPGRGGGEGGVPLTSAYSSGGGGGGYGGGGGAGGGNNDYAGKGGAACVLVQLLEQTA